MKNPVAIVTGAGAGIGRACALSLAAAGYQIVVVDIDEDAASQTAEAVKESGQGALPERADVSRRAGCHLVAQAALSAWGRIDALVANAGVQIAAPLDQTTDEQWETILGVNLKGAAFCVEAVLPAMLDQERGSIALVSSINAVTGSAEMPVYDASKAALLGLMRSLAVRYGHAGIRVNAVGPGATLTDFHLKKAAAAGLSEDDLRASTAGYGLVGRVAEPAEIAAVVRFLLSDEASFVTGQFLLVDGGASLAGAAG